jgi:hypothetical protein
MFGITKKKEKQKDNVITPDDDDVTPEKEESYNKKGTNPYGMIVFFMGGLSFIKGYTYVFIPIITIIFAVITYRTFDKEKEDNPFPFYIGIVLALIGVLTFTTHEPPPFP